MPWDLLNMPCCGLTFLIGTVVATVVILYLRRRRYGS